MNREERRRRRRAAGRRAATPGPTPGSYVRIGSGGPEDVDPLFADAVLAVAAGVVEPTPLDPRQPATGDVPSRLFVAVVPDVCPPLAPLFAARGTGPQQWTSVGGELGWSAATASDDQPARVALKLALHYPVRVSAKILFLPELPGVADALALAAQGGVIALMTVSGWQTMAQLAPEGGTLADMVERAVLLPIDPSPSLPPFLAHIPRQDN